MVETLEAEVEVVGAAAAFGEGGAVDGAFAVEGIFIPCGASQV